MKPDEKIRNRLAELIQMGEGVLATKRSPGPNVIGDDRVDTQQAYQWATSVQNLLVRVFGQTSEHYKNFTAQVGSHLTFSPTYRAQGILKAAKDDYDNGQLFELRRLVALEADCVRSDKHEGTLLWMQPEKAKLSMEIDGQFHEIPGIIGPLIYRNAGSLAIDVYCMYALRPHEGLELIDSRNFQFGDTYAVLLNGDEFLRRVRATAEAGGHQVTWRPVEYVDAETFHGRAGVFRKASALSYQSEFRIAIGPGAGGPLSLILGDLSDITLTGDLASVNKRIRLSQQ